jgi:hypothetical protein
MSVETQGRRRPDTRHGEHPDDVQAGDYWKYLRDDGEPMHSADPGNLTGTCWGFYAPNGCGIGTLMYHTVREHEDGTCTIAHGDGSSNSVLITGGEGGEWHGYMDHGVWKSC